MVIVLSFDYRVGITRELFLYQKRINWSREITIRLLALKKLLPKERTLVERLLLGNMKIALVYTLLLSLSLRPAECAQPKQGGPNNNPKPNNGQPNPNSGSTNANPTGGSSNNGNSGNRAGSTNGGTVPVPVSTTVAAPVQNIAYNQGSAPANTPAGFVNKDDYGNVLCSNSTAPPGLVEPSKCVLFNDTRIKSYLNNSARFSYMNYDPRCDTNSCPQGCCRFYTNLLRCDYDNLFDTLPVSYFSLVVSLDPCLSILQLICFSFESVSATTTPSHGRTGKTRHLPPTPASPGQATSHLQPSTLVQLPRRLLARLLPSAVLRHHFKSMVRHARRARNAVSPSAVCKTFAFVNLLLGPSR